jgi:hypothetical protein
VLIAVFCKTFFARDSKKYPLRVVTHLNDNIKSIEKGYKNIKEAKESKYCRVASWRNQTARLDWLKSGTIIPQSALVD